MDALLVVAFVVGCFTGGIFGSIGAYFLKDAYVQRKLERLEAENEDLNDAVAVLQNRSKAVIGNEAKREKAERLQGAMFEFAQAMQEPNANMMEVAKALGAKYPDIMMDLVKKGIKLK